VSKFRTVFGQIKVRPRLSTATVVGLAVLALAPMSLSGPTRAIIAWDAGAGLYVILAWIMMFRGNVEGMAKRARLQDDGAAVVLSLTVVAAVASLAAIALELMGIQGSPEGQHMVRLTLVAVTVICSWFTIHTSFALHYAHEYYVDPHRGKEGCLDFPGTTQPSYVDFLYFSLVLGTTSQTSDVAIKRRELRRLAMIHGVIAFFFNTTLLALAVNIAGGGR
jgi:uncharacterized membrane protein